MNDLQKIEFQKSLQKIKDNKQLEYFKRELIKVLEASEDKVSKAIEDYDKSVAKTFREEFGIEKSRGYGIGTIREWKGRKYKKIAPNKWRLVYESNSRGAKQSIAYLKKAVMDAKSTDELLEIVMQNINRFQDANGKTLDIVSELQQAVKESKAKLNVGKPSTQEQIEKIKEQNDKEYNPVKAAIGNYVFIHDKYKGFASHEFKDDEQKLKEAEKFMNEMVDLKQKINLLQNGYTYEGNPLGISDEEYDTLTDTAGKLNSNIYSFETVVNGLKRKIQNEKTKELINEVDIENLTDEDKELINEFDKEISGFVESKMEGSLWDLEKQIRDLFKYSNVDILHGRMWLKQHNLFTPDEAFQYIREKINEGLAARRKAKIEEKKKQVNEKIDSINSQVKTYSDEEIQKSFAELETVQKKIDALKEKVKVHNGMKKENDVAYNTRSAELSSQGISRWSKEYDDDPMMQTIKNTSDRLWQETKDIRAERDELEKKLDPLMDAIGYYYLNKFDYEKDASIDSCKTQQEVMDLIKSKDWYNEKGKKNLDLKNVDIEAAKDMFKCMERIFAIFPEQKGLSSSMQTNYSNSRTWAFGGSGSGITFNSKYWKHYDDLKADYEKTEGGFHPKGTSAIDIIYHEYYHVMTTGLDLAATIKNKVTKKLKMKGKKGGPKQGELIRFGVSEYATKNADEFGAECFCQAMGSKNPTQFAIEVFKETLKAKKYMRGLI